MILASSLDPTTRRLRQLVESGRTIREAATDVGLSASQAWVRIAALGDAVDRRRRRPVTTDDHQRIVDLCHEGLSRRKVASEVNRAVSVVQKHIAREAGDDDRDSPRRIQSAVKCQRCGHKINVLPCVVCMARDAKA